MSVIERTTLSEIIFKTLESIGQEPTAEAIEKIQFEISEQLTSNLNINSPLMSNEISTYEKRAFDLTIKWAYSKIYGI